VQLEAFGKRRRRREEKLWSIQDPAMPVGHVQIAYAEGVCV